MADQDAAGAPRDQILDSAARVFAEKGYNGARVDDVVEASGLSKGTVYWHYKSKDGLLQAVMGRLLQVELKKLDRLTADGGSVSSGLLAFVRQFTADLKRVDWLMPLALDFYAMARRKAWVKRFIQSYYAEYQTVLGSVIQAGINRGEFRPVSVEDTAVVITGLLEGLILMWTIDATAVPLDHVVEAGLQVVLRGLLADPGSWTPTGGRAPL